MIVIPGLSQPLKAAGKHITSWTEGSGGLGSGKNLGCADQP